MKKPPRIEELSKVIPGELKKHTVSSAMFFVGILSDRFIRGLSSRWSDDMAVRGSLAAPRG